jgi:hypothetical protein
MEVRIAPAAVAKVVVIGKTARELSPVKRAML